MNFYIVICGYGFGFQLGGYDHMKCCLIILSWHIVKNHQIWRSETHSRGTGGYHYRCIKNGQLIEDLSFRSPVVNNA